MGGGLMQLVAYGAQDVYLTGNPQITFFKVVYRRHTNFAIECIEQTFNGTADFGRTVTCNIARNGDLITKMYLKIDLEDTIEGNKYSFVRNLGHAVIQNCKVEIGGSKIDEQYGDWLNIWEELAGETSHRRGLDKMIGNTKELRKYSEKKPKYTMYVPMKFWFCRNNGLALPLIALQYHDVRVTFNFLDANQCISTAHNESRTDVRFKDATLLIDYVYLDSEERKRFAQASHEYLIEQLQYTGEESVNTQNDRFRLNFNHPCKALYWALKLGKYSSGENVVCLDDEGNVNSEYFAKVLFLASRANMSPEGCSSEEGMTTNTALKGLFAALTSDKVIRGHIVSANSSGKVECSLDNVVIIENNITSSQMSQATITALAKGNDDNTDAVAVLKKFARSMRAPGNYGLYVDGTQNPVSSGKLQLNGHDRFATRQGNYFNYVQPYEHWSNTPSDGINCYSFALNPEEHQPSGSCNMSRIDNATLLLNFGEPNAKANDNFAQQWLSDNTVIQIYTVNYNVLRIMSGMGGLAYSN
jgi:hypothetical protein